MTLFYLILFHFISFIYLNLLYLLDSTLTSPYVLSVNLYFHIKKVVNYREEEEEEEEEEESTPSSRAHRIHARTKDTDLFNLEDVGFLQALRVRDDNAALGAG